ncbi:MULTISPECIES: ABC transporter substrate-binding protein [Microbacterium]|uniref:ABC transporter substrate-binding protein n=1 Tax=Microbacterium TaxID=33882 RepID=UPI0027803B31|nr:MULTISPECIES: ABC transporter substrate-binding protein [Microbacterium]MDQ1082334.1 peptide/nickel transport system substrate-binding protein [Microbacterium sp. SORGH_AS_0344]MDQ1168895.1 peptide/nickel transport system substrate-binding protein [Microbacterium proteolyticum]
MSSLLHRAGILLAVVSASTLALTACSAPGETADNSSIVYATGKDISCLDPHVGGDMPQASIAAQYLDSLVSQDAQGNIHPWLATSWEVSPDALTWTFHLRDDVTFTDGTPFDASAVKANLDHMVDPATQSGTAGGYLKPYESTQVVDDTTAVVTLNRPYAAFLEVLAQPFLGIESPTALARPQEENCASPVGSGPFKIVSYTPQQEVVLERNDEYNSAPPYAEHSGPASIAKITWRIIPENASRYGSLRTGDVDVIDSLPPENTEEASGDPNVVVSRYERPGNPTSLQLNVTRAPFDDLSVRQAFLLSADARTSIDSVFLGTATYVGGPLSSVTPFYSPDFEHVYDLDLDRANALLDAAGWTARDSDGYRTRNGQRLSISYPYTAADNPAALTDLITQIQANVKKAGFHLDVQQADSATTTKRSSTFDYDLRTQYWNTNTPDVLRIVFSTEYLQSSGWVPNGSGYSNPQLDEILNDALATTTVDQRRSLYDDAQKIISDAALQVTLYAQSTDLASRKDAVSNVVVEPSLSLPYLYDAQVVG